MNNTSLYLPKITAFCESTLSGSEYDTQVYMTMYSYCVMYCQQSSNNANHIYAMIHDKCIFHLKRQLKILMTIESPVDMLNFCLEIKNKYTSTCNKLSHVFSYLDRYFVPKQRTSQAQFKDKVFPHCISLYWSDFLKAKAPQVITSTMDLLHDERINGEKKDRQLICDIMELFHYFTTKENVVEEIFNQDIYHLYYQAYYLDSTNNFFIDLRTKYSNYSLLKFLDTIQSIIELENERCQAYISKEEHCSFWVQLNKIFIGQQCAFIIESFKLILQENEMNVLKKAYSVLYEGESLKGVINFFEEYCFTIGNEAIKRWDSKENLLKLVDIIITYYNTMKTLIQQSFDNHSLFQSAFTKVFRSIINENVVIKLDHIDVVFPEYLARYTDVVLRSGKDEEIIDNLSSVFEIYDNIDNKDIFETFYAKAISKRMLLKGIDFSIEQNVFNDYKKFFSSSLCYKIQKMSRDISISHEMTTEFCNIVSVDFMFSVNVLQTAVWPVDPQQFLFNLPNELSNIHTLFSQWYSKQHQRRKLQWIHQYARGKISSTYLKKTYIFYGSAYQLSILLLFNGNDTYSIDEIFSIIQSRVDIITSIIQSLKDVGLLEQNDEQKYYLKQQYQSNKTKIVLPIPKPVQQQETKQNEEVEINTQRISLIESVVVRLMKRNKKMSHNELIQEVSTSLSSRFRPPIQLVKKAIESLIEREYLARSDVLKDDYVYVD